MTVKTRCLFLIVNLNVKLKTLLKRVDVMLPIWNQWLEIRVSYMNSALMEKVIGMGLFHVFSYEHGFLLSFTNQCHKRNI